MVETSLGPMFPRFFWGSHPEILGHIWILRDGGRPFFCSLWFQVFEDHAKFFVSDYDHHHVEAKQKKTGHLIHLTGQIIATSHEFSTQMVV